VTRAGVDVALEIVLMPELLERVAGLEVVAGEMRTTPDIPITNVAVIVL
jgi:hypothetical protein